MSKITISEWYERVNSTWPSDRKYPIPSDAEAIAGAKKLYRFMFGETFQGEIRITSGRRYTWIRRGVMSVNPAYGWSGRRGIVHLLSHYAALKLYPTRLGYRPHGAEHARLEIRCIKEVLKRGWLDGALLPKEKPAPAEVNPKQVEYDRVMARIKSWTTKAKRAETALKKLEKARKRLERTLAL